MIPDPMRPAMRICPRREHLNVHSVSATVIKEKRYFQGCVEGPTVSYIV